MTCSLGPSPMLTGGLRVTTFLSGSNGQSGGGDIPRGPYLGDTGRRPLAEWARGHP